MARRAWFRWLVAGQLAMAGLLAAAGRCPAREAASEFLKALRDHGYAEETVAYLEQMRASALVPDDFRQVVDYEIGLALIDTSRLARGTTERQQRLAAARERFAQFLADHPLHPLAGNARTQLANLLVERGRILAEQAAELTPGSQEGKRLMEEARALYGEADAAFADLEKQLEDAFKKFGFIAPNDLKKAQQRNQVRRELLQVQLAHAWAAYETALTHQPGSREQKAGLAEAHKKFADLHAKYGDQLAGLYARLGQGCVYRQRGEAARAFSVFEELLAWPDEPQDVRAMKNRAAIQAIETAMLPSMKKYKEALDLYRAWAAGARDKEPASDEGLAIKYLAGEAALAYVRTLPATESQQSPLRKDALRMARDNFAFVAAAAGPYQQKARVKLLDPLLGVNLPEPATFAEARDRAKAAVEGLAALDAESKLLRRQDDKEGYRECLKRIAATRDNAIKYCQLAIQIAARDVPAGEVDSVRYYLAYLHYHAGSLHEAVVLGKLLSQRPTDTPSAQEGARIALAACDALAREAAPGEQRQAAAGQAAELARRIVQRWGDQPVGDDARIVLLQAAAGEGRLEKVLEYLEQIRPESSRRGDAELLAGQALWAGYVRASRLPEAERPPAADMEKMANQAQKVLQEGIGRMRKSPGGPSSHALAAAALSMAQICLSAGQADQAVQWLEDPKIGPKTLLDANSPAVLRANFPVETCKAALRAYIATQQLAKAEQALQQLDQRIRAAGDGEVGKRLTQAYIGLGRDLQQQVERLRNEAKAEPLAKMLQALDAFFAQLAKRERGGSFHQLQWVAETLFGIGAGFDHQTGKPPPDAERYYGKAAESYRALLKRCLDEKTFAPQPEAVVAAQVRLARCLRRLGQYEEAVGLLVDVLQKHETLVDAQIEAAYTYQAWGEQKPEYFNLAIAGGTLHPEIWGWGRLSKQLSGVAKYREAFHEARYNLALCHSKLAQTAAEADERDRLLERAESDIRLVQRLHPDMGGKSWYDKYNELLKRIQKLRGQPPAGLQGAEKATPSKD